MKEINTGQICPNINCSSSTISKFHQIMITNWFCFVCSCTYNLKSPPQIFICLSFNLICKKCKWVCLQENVSLKVGGLLFFFAQMLSIVPVKSLVSFSFQELGKGRWKEKDDDYDYRNEDSLQQAAGMKKELAVNTSSSYLLFGRKKVPPFPLIVFLISSSTPPPPQLNWNKVFSWVYPTFTLLIFEILWNSLQNNVHVQYDITWTTQYTHKWLKVYFVFLNENKKQK